MSHSVEKRPLHVPSLEELAPILQNALKMNFAEVDVCVVECPDLTNEPFRLEGKGLCGSPRLGDVGGVPHLVPLAHKDKVYDIKQLAAEVHLPNAFVLGAGAGPHTFVGVNSELMANVKTGEKASNGSRISKIDSSGNYELVKLPESETRCALMLNMFASEGRAGKVLRIWAKKRTGENNFVSCLRQALESHYGEKPVGLGGTFRLVEGSAWCHVMPDFSSAPLSCDKDINKWLRFFDMPAPMVFLSTLISKDPGLDLRLEHSHGYGNQCGGHYHYDTTPDAVEYEAFYNVAEFIYRIDKPKVTHDFGRN
ncbi:ester hydrolase C11orf54 homolog [Procambarus clarkii]|uniref:ester hydrolase C11orf54 homolog n=1 Tax=Procambarus clarkii TaxID=6728 RepID=UPI001E67116B|nr:ester hydrolase C11orf54 homolog [Procambarus clarkii]